LIEYQTILYFLKGERDFSGNVSAFLYFLELNTTSYVGKWIYKLI